MRVQLLAPRPKKIKHPDAIFMARRWIRFQLQVLKQINPTIQAFTSLQLGLDSDFAEICIQEKVDSIIAVLSCTDQERFWDLEKKNRFKNLLDHCVAVRATNTEYKKGCIAEQNKIIDLHIDHLLEPVTVLAIKSGSWSKFQKARLNKSYSLKYNVKTITF